MMRILDPTSNGLFQSSKENLQDAQENMVYLKLNSSGHFLKIRVCRIDHGEL